MAKYEMSQVFPDNYRKLSQALSGKYENYVIGSNVNKDHETISPFSPF